ncbi:MAG: hypothetical protein R6V55_17200 [Desulfovermiculus sp.]
MIRYSASAFNALKIPKKNRRLESKGRVALLFQGFGQCFPGQGKGLPGDLALRNKGLKKKVHEPLFVVSGLLPYSIFCIFSRYRNDIYHFFPISLP